MGIICESCGRDIDALGQDNMGLCWPLCEDCWNERRFRESLNAKAEEAVMHKPVGQMRNAAVQNLRKSIELAYETSRERALALTKLDECELWLGRCELKETAAPAAGSAAQEAAMPCLKADEARGFARPDVNVEVKAEVTAEELAKSLREVMQPAMRMAVE